MSRPARRMAGLGVLGVLTLTAPVWLANPYYLHILIMAGIFAILALSLNLLLGYTGQLSLGHAAFFGIGAYTSALLTLRLDWSVWAGLAAGTLTAALAGWAIGRLALKLRGAYFVLVTISFAGVISLVSVNWMDLTNGPLGLPGIPPPVLGPWSLRSKAAYYYLVLAAVFLAWLVCRRLVDSRIGRAFVALRENEALAESVGIDVTRYLVLAAVVSAAMAGLAGGLYAHYTRFVSPEVFLFTYTVTMVIMVVAGGKGTLAGPLVGALLFTVLPEALREATSWQWQMLAYGVILVLLVRFLPLGIITSAWTAPLQTSPVHAGCDHRPTKKPSSELSLQVRDLAVQFGGVSALAGVSFDVRPGSITSLIGPNGAGKTTAFNAITGYLRVARGLITYGDVALNGLRPSAIARRGVVRTFQKTSVFPALSVIENVLTGLHLRGQAGLAGVLANRRWVRDEEAWLVTDAEQLISFVGLGSRPHAVASALAYGEQRLVELAVALAARPALLLLDEPAAGLAGSERDAVSELVRRIREQGITVLLVEHDMRMVMGISDTVIVLNHGVVIAEGPPAAIQSHPEVVRAYLGSAAAQA